MLSSPSVSAFTIDRIIIGSSILLSCDVHSIPKPQIIWNKDGTLITLNNRFVFIIYFKS